MTFNSTGYKSPIGQQVEKIVTLLKRIQLHPEKHNHIKKCHHISLKRNPTLYLPQTMAHISCGHRTSFPLSALLPIP